MTQRIRIKDIATKAGVSSGTVDRVLHSRGNVSEDSRIAVERVLKEIDYKPNLYLSSISLHKSYTIAVVIPDSVVGEYWGYIKKGILNAVKELDSIDIICEFLIYDQFDISSCQNVYSKILDTNPQGVIIGSTFNDETVQLTRSLDQSEIPYVYVDSMVADTNPYAYFSSDPYNCGYIIGKLIDNITPIDSEYALFQSVRLGDISANTTILRKAGFMSYFGAKQKESKIHRVNFSVLNPQDNIKLIGDFFADNPNVKGAVVLSSRGSAISDYFKLVGITDVKLICVDMTSSNYQAMQDDLITFIIAQRPQQYGSLAIRSLVKLFLYKKKIEMKNILPIDIILKENSEMQI